MRSSETKDGGERLLVHTESMSYGPHAVARHRGKVLFVRGAAPDEDIELVVREDRRTYAYADALRVVRASAQRRVPPCPYLPECGGCPWQHLDYEAQIDSKRAIVREQMRRLGGMEVEVAPVKRSPQELGYRQRLKLRAEGGAVGYYAGGSHRLVPIEHCLLAIESVDAAIPSARELVTRLQTRVRRVEIVGCGDGSAGVVVAGEAEGAWVAADREECRRWCENHGQVRGLSLSGKGWRRSWGNTEVALPTAGGLPLSVRAGSFLQVNAAANRILAEEATHAAGVEAGMRVLDLYAGAGNLSVPFARAGARVVAVEQNPIAAEDGAANACRLGLEVEVRSHRVEAALRDILDRAERFDVVVLDPPRSGAAGAIAPLLRLAAPRIVYVSCDPATLARDAKQLAVAYRIAALQPVDMFPQTYHIETVARFDLAC